MYIYIYIYPFYRQPLCTAIPPFLSFFRSLCFWQDLFDNIAPMKYQINAKINSCGKVIYSFSEHVCMYI